METVDKQANFILTKAFSAIKISPKIQYSFKVYRYNYNTGVTK